MLQLDAVETLDRRLRLLAGLEEHGTPTLGAARIGVAHGDGVDDVADLLEHLTKVLARRRPRQVTNDNLQTTGVLRTSLNARALLTRARTLDAHDDGSALNLRVVHLFDRVLRLLRRGEINQRPALGATTALTSDFTLHDSHTERRRVRRERLLRGLPREVPEEASAAVAPRRGIAEHRRVELFTSTRRFRRRLILTNRDRAITERGACVTSLSSVTNHARNSQTFIDFIHSRDAD